MIIGAYYLLRPSEAKGPGKTETAPLPPIKPPTAYPSIGSVRTAFEDVKTNWRMGRITAQDTLDSAGMLLDAGTALMADGVGDEVAWNDLVGDLDRLVQDVEDYVALQSVPA